MSFHRTVSGLSNQHLFYGVDAIVFTEGGRVSYSASDIKEGLFNEKSPDIIFWKKLFVNFGPAKRLKFKAVGSKTTVHSIAIEVSNNDIRSVIAVMDCEFDDLHQKLLNHPNILYTRGYSWENDVWTPSLIVKLLEECYGDEIDSQIVNDPLTQFITDIEECVYADALEFEHNCSFFPRLKYMSCINLDPKSAPSLNNQYVNDLFQLKGLDRTKLKNMVTYNLDSASKCFGHLLNDYIYHLIRHISQNILQIKIMHKELLETVAISKFLDFCNQNVREYYNQNIQNVFV